MLGLQLWVSRLAFEVALPSEVSTYSGTISNVPLLRAGVATRAVSLSSDLFVVTRFLVGTFFPHIWSPKSRCVPGLSSELLSSNC